MRLSFILNPLVIICIGLSMFVLDWVDVSASGIIDTPLFQEALRQALEQFAVENPQAFGEDLSTLVKDYLQLLLSTTGWDLVNFPTVQRFLRIVLYLPLGVAILAAVGLVAAVGNLPSLIVQRIGLAQIVVSVLSFLTLFFYASRIRVFGLDPGLFGFAATLVGISLTTGYYVALLGLVISIGAGVAGLQTQPRKSQPSHRQRKSLYKRRGL